MTTERKDPLVEGIARGMTPITGGPVSVTRLDASAVTVNVGNCARCGWNHHSLEFKRLANPTDDWQWWASCPTNGQPILMKFVHDPKKEEAPDAP